jgi:hypothetical protein
MAGIRAPLAANTLALLKDDWLQAFRSQVPSGRQSSRTRTDDSYFLHPPILIRRNYANNFF